MTIAAPALANPMAIPRPKPPLPPVTIATLPCRSNSSITRLLSLTPQTSLLRPTRLLTIVVRAVVYMYKCVHLARDAWEYTIANARALWRREKYRMLTSDIDGYLTYYDID